MRNGHDLWASHVHGVRIAPEHKRQGIRHDNPHLLRVRPEQVKEVHRKARIKVASCMGEVIVPPAGATMRLALAPRHGARFKEILWDD